MARTKAFDEGDVLDKALNIFWHKGYNGTSMQDLIDGLGISRSSLYDTYSDKRALFLAALQKYRLEQAKAMVEMVDNSTSIVETIRCMLKSIAGGSTKSNSQMGCFVINTTIELSPHDEEVAAIIAANRTDVEDAFYRAIKKGQERGEISKSHSARALSRFVFNIVAGLRVAAKAGADKKVFDDTIAVAMSALVK